MLVKVKSIGLLTGKPIMILPKEIAKWLNINVGERLVVKKYNENKQITAIIDITKIEEKVDYVYASDEIMNFLSLKDNDIVEIFPAQKPLSVLYIKEKLDGKRLDYKKLFEIMKSIVNNELTEAEISYFISSSYIRGMNKEEIINLIRAMVDVGNRIKFNYKHVLDKHCIGGVAGNRTTPIVVSIIVAAIKELKLNAIIPKTSSRAISSAAGTADVIELLARVEFDIEEIKRIVNKVGGCLIWGGSLNISPADDKIIQVERLLNLDPKSQLIASILSKKISMGSNKIIIDIPYGKGAKVESLKEALELKKMFEYSGRKFNLTLKVLITNGNEPIGNGIGPCLELLDVLKVLKNSKDKPLSLYNKSLYLAKNLLSLIIDKNKAERIAEKMIKEGLAYEAFKRIIKEQKGSIRELTPSSIFYELKANRSGKIVEINNKKINFIARVLGCPADKFAGIYLNKHLNESVEKNEVYAILYAETKEKLDYGLKVFKELEPIVIK
jgi:putative thymidine phosphorylase